MNRPRLKLLASNVVFFGGVAVVSRTLNVVGLPLLAWIIADPGVLGRFDLLVTVGSLGAALANFGVNEAAYKVYFDDTSTESRRKVLNAMVSMGLLATIAIALLAFFGLISARHLHSNTTIDGTFPLLTALFICLFRCRFLFEVPLSMENRKGIIGSVAVVEIVIFYCVAFLFCGKFGNGNVLLPSARMLSLILAAGALYHYSLQLEWEWRMPRNMSKRLLKLGLPLTFSSLLYWGLSLSDRVVISTYLDVGALGIYAVCAKFAAISELIRTGVNQGMAYFIYSTAKEAGHERRMFLVTSFFFISATVIFGMGDVLGPVLVNLFLPAAYARAAPVIPYLAVGPLLLAAFQIIIAELVLAEKTIWITVAQVAGCIAALSISVLAITRIGLRGPAIGTLLGYSTMCIVALYSTNRIGRQPFLRQTVAWGLPLFAVFLLSFMPGSTGKIVISLISAATLIIWCYWHRKICVAGTKVVINMLLPRWAR